MAARQTSIKDVAEAAGVSFKTVARVLNNEPHVRPELRERVRAAAEQLGYAPNGAARELAGGRTFLIGLMFDNPSESYISKCQTGAITRCQETGHHLVVEPLEPGDDVPRTLDLILSRLRVDGLILTPPICDDPFVLDAIERAGVRYVRIAPMNEVERTPFVAIDDSQAAYDMTRHLLAQGHRDIGFVAGPAGHAASPRRLSGFLRAMGEARLAVSPKRIGQGDFSFESGMIASAPLLAGERRPTAIFAANDDMALGVMSAASRAGLAVPKELSVAGFDDSEPALMAWPELTTIRQPIAAMSAAAADMLIEASGKGQAWPVPSRQLDYKLIVRGSTAPPGC
ncbi:LacI family DNA-binding transcriptional regulator [Phenylobacterium montanum]|uniref:LacI family DNA-binding transcriptional regulator n=2 Tax=Phenylobacterium montanum TaxID=2823693 RepID=A0A975IX26_9CAUL|nr:LacI family DNA-binding transcriptional regulator [Caulobacter sp. S6]